MGRGYAREGPIYPESMGRGRTGRKRTAALALATGATALALGLGTAPASAAAAAAGFSHSITTTTGARVSCTVVVYQEWLDFRAVFRTELQGPTACRATEVVVGWRYTDTAGVRHRGREVAEGGRVAEAAFSNVADGGDIAGGHRVEFAGCASNCTFGTYVFEPFGSSK
jgi:hypothetical protein